MPTEFLTADTAPAPREFLTADPPQREFLTADAPAKPTEFLTADTSIGKPAAPVSPVDSIAPSAMRQGESNPLARAFVAQRPGPLTIGDINYDQHAANVAATNSPLENFSGGALQGVAGVTAATAEIASKLAGDGKQDLRDWATEQRNAAANVPAQPGFATTAGRFVGPALLTAPAAMAEAPAAGLAIIGGALGVGGTASEINAQRQAGKPVSASDEAKAEIANAVIGALSGYLGGKALPQGGNLASNVAINAGVGSALNAAQTAGENVVAQKTFEPERPTGQGVAESALGGGLSQGVLAGIHSAVRRSPAARADTQSAQPPQPQPDAPAPQPFPQRGEAGSKSQPTGFVQDELDQQAASLRLQSQVEQARGPEGEVLKESVTFNNPLKAKNWVAAKNQLGLPTYTGMHDLIRAAKKAGHDGIVFESHNGKPEFVDLSPPPPASDVAPPAATGNETAIEQRRRELARAGVPPESAAAIISKEFPRQQPEAARTKTPASSGKQYASDTLPKPLADAAKDRRRKVLQNRMERGQNVPAKMLEEFKGEDWVQSSTPPPAGGTQRQPGVEANDVLTAPPESAWLQHIRRVNEDRLRMDAKAKELEAKNPVTVPKTAVTPPASVGESATFPDAGKGVVPTAPEPPDPENPRGFAGAPSPAFRQPKQMAGTTKSQVTPEQIIQKMSSITKTPMRVGHGWFAQRKAAGWFNLRGNVVRQKVANQLDVAYHEFGHAAHDRIIGWKIKFPNQVANELAKMGRELYGSRQPSAGYRREGLAEFIAREMLGDDMVKAAPETMKWMQGVFKQHPEFGKQYSELKQMATAWQDQGAAARVASQIDRIDRGPIGIAKRGYEAVSKLFSPYAWTNDAHPLERAQSQLLREANIDPQTLPAEMRPATVRAALKMSAPGTARHFIERAAVDTSYKPVGSSLKDVLAPVKKNLDDFLVYAYAKRAEFLHGKGINPGVSAEDAAYTVKQLETPEFQKAADGITEWSGHLIDYVVGAGGLSREAADAIRAANPIYLPLKRFFDDTHLGGSSGMGNKGAANQGAAVKRIKGSGRAIIDPLDSLVQQAEHMISLGNKISVAKSVADLAEKVPGSAWFAEKVQPPQSATRLELGDVKKQLEAMGVDLSGANLDSVLTVFNQANKYVGKDNIVTLWRNGKREFWELNPDVYRVITEMDKDYIPPFLRFIAAPARAVRLGATGINVGFGAFNTIRDAVTSAVYGKASKVPGVASLRGLWSQLLKKDGAQQFHAAGGHLTTLVGADRVSASKIVAESLSSNPAIRTLKHPVDALRAVMETIEAAPRVAEFGKALQTAEAKYGKGSRSAVLEAMLAAKDVTTDFTRAGVVSSVVNQFIPFFNARLQSTSKFFRTFRGSPIRASAAATAKAVSTITIPSVMLWWMNKDEDWYKELPAHERNNYWHFSLNGGENIYRIPIPFELGKVFGSAPVAALDSAYQSDPKRVSESVFDTLKSFLPVNGIFESIPTIVKPAAEVIANYDPWRDRQIIPQYDVEGKLPKDQFNQWTTETSKKLGEMLNVSPAKIDHLIGGYTGGLALDGIKWAEHFAGIKKGREGIPVASRFATRDPYAGGGETARRMYARKDELEKQRGSKELTTEERGELTLLGRKAGEITDARKAGADGKQINAIAKRQVDPVAAKFEGELSVLREKMKAARDSRRPFPERARLNRLESIDNAIQTQRKLLKSGRISEDTATKRIDLLMKRAA